MPNREVVTLQIGHYSNCIGTHLWNIEVTLKFKLNLYTNI